MTTTRVAILLSLTLFAIPAGASPLIELRWDGCGGTRTVEPYTPTEHVLTVVLTGAEGDYDGIECTITLDGRCNWNGPEAAYIPHAWRFDNAGCQAGLLQITRPRSDNGCPGLGASQTFDSVTLGKVCVPGYPYGCYDLPALVIRIGSFFPMRHLSADSRYVVARVVVPMENTVAGVDPNGVLCSCAGIPLTVLSSAMLSPSPGPFSGFYSNDFVFWAEFNGCAIGPQPAPGLDANNQPCMPTPAHPQSWGAVKAHYR